MLERLRPFGSCARKGGGWPKAGRSTRSSRAPGWRPRLRLRAQLLAVEGTGNLGSDSLPTQGLLLSRPGRRVLAALCLWGRRGSPGRRRRWPPR